MVISCSESEEQNGLWVQMVVSVLVVDPRDPLADGEPQPLHPALWERVLPLGSLQASLPWSWQSVGSGQSVGSSVITLKVPARWLMGVHHSEGGLHPKAICLPEWAVGGLRDLGPPGEAVGTDTGNPPGHRGPLLTPARPLPSRPPSSVRWKTSDELIPPGASEGGPGGIQASPPGRK